MTDRSVTHATFVIERVYDASPARVFKAFSDPAARNRWFVKADNWPIAEYTFDFRVGGRETGRFSPDGTMMVYNETIYHDIVPDNRMIFAYSMLIGDKRISSSLATVELKAEGAKTRLFYTEQGAFLDGLDKVADREKGCRDLYEQLAIELERSAAVA
ncbi:SRPBCC family protein [Pararhizobium sp.]|uniref:SRPBCC family protein n=1 Tax=Pararhizobium sp. TaxID=1977563 RepID=UPI003D0B37DD